MPAARARKLERLGWWFNALREREDCGSWVAMRESLFRGGGASIANPEAEKKTTPRCER